MKEKVFEGSRDECYEFIRANRFSLLISMMEIRNNKEVWAIRKQ